MKRFLRGPHLCIVQNSRRYSFFRASSRRKADNLHRIPKAEMFIARALKYSVSHFIDCNPAARRLRASLIAFGNAVDQIRETTRMNTIELKSKIRARLRNFGVALFGTALGLAITASALAADAVTLRVGDQKGGNRSLLEIAGLAKDLPYKIEWSEFPAAAPILEALNAGALDVGYTGDLAFLSVYAAGAPIKAIGGTRADARTQAILVRRDSPIKSAADLKGKRLAGTRGGWGQFLIDATLEKAGHKVDDAIFAPLGPVDAKIALVAGSIDGWAVWEPYVSYATFKDNARIVADGEGLTPTITFIVASDQAISTKRAAVQDLVQRLNKARLWSLDHLSEYAKSTAELTKLPEDVLLSAYSAQRTSPIVIDETIVNEVQEASDRATRYGILPKTLDARPWTAASPRHRPDSTDATASTTKRKGPASSAGPFSQALTDTP
jgi:sulfonate transport system substrate-binding protein